MKISEAIEKAIEGGYQELFWDGCKECGGVGRDDNIDFVCTVCKGTGNGDLLLEEMSAQWERFTSDPLFWQSLGKAMGWEVVAENGYNEEKLIRSYRGYSKGYGEKMWKSALKKEAWNYQWHRFIDKLADGGTAEQFFEEL